jgi:hypothetical protein
MKTFGMGYSANSWDGLTKIEKKGYDEHILEDALFQTGEDMTGLEGDVPTTESPRTNCGFF